MRGRVSIHGRLWREKGLLFLIRIVARICNGWRALWWFLLSTLSTFGWQTKELELGTVLNRTEVGLIRRRLFEHGRRESRSECVVLAIDRFLFKVAFDDVSMTTSMMKWCSLQLATTAQMNVKSWRIPHYTATVYSSSHSVLCVGQYLERVRSSTPAFTELSQKKSIASVEPLQSVLSAVCLRFTGIKQMPLSVQCD